MTDPESQTSYVRVPPEMLSHEALEGVLGDFVLREGTDYGIVELSFEAKKNQVRKQLANGEAVVLFDPATETCTIALTRELHPGHTDS